MNLAQHSNNADSTPIVILKRKRVKINNLMEEPIITLLIKLLKGVLFRIGNVYYIMIKDWT